MGKQTGIDWTDHTWNPWVGCIKVSLGCANCYMYRDQVRYGNDPKRIHRTARSTFSAPLAWKESARVFTCSWSDFFIEAADEWRDEAWSIIRRTPHLTYQILTKRPQNIKDRLPDDWENGYPNVWLGVSVETSKYLWRIESLDEVPAYIKFVSYEPALGAVDFTPYTPVIQWIIGGGESGPNARPVNLDWFRDVRDMCRKYGIAYFHKQNGGNKRIDGHWGGDELDGMRHKEFPHRITLAAFAHTAPLDWREAE